MIFNSCQILVFTYDFQYITRNCQTQSSLRRVEDHADEIKNYIDDFDFDFDYFGLTWCKR